MAFCSNCGAPLEDGATFCQNCGAPVGAQGSYDPNDHTNEMDPRDISDNKVIALLPYCASLVGVIIALIAANQSKFAAFHVRQALKLYVCEIICAVACIIPVIGWIAGGIGFAICLVLDVIGFINVCCGKAKELPIVSALKFMK